MGSPLGRQAERDLCNFHLDRILLTWGLEQEILQKELKALQQMEQVEQAQPPSPVLKAPSPVPKAPSPVPKARRRPEDLFGGPLRTVRVARASSSVLALSVLFQAAAVKPRAEIGAADSGHATDPRVLQS